ncbi:UDP-glucose 4-epimerase GalE [Halobacillus naozhouensis]|uniref:UDP-glucose 4-epimerase n=1 Tax=Halobacillus naozhouensis TaxID=554880 RepID=A0ABY8IZ74_9BACI|nr:UDP-glucose 4-epimerase GalE [Halobacillus naozhouensis]WFT73805.1 UDP-glucose 4-epimerase GalE [Halobacillus naozhouensis]
MAILVTGGAGYIGSHTCVELLNNDYEVVVADNFSNSKKIVFDKIAEITGKEINYYEIDLKEKSEIEEVFAKNEIDSVIHFAGLKSVGESVTHPMKYYQNNVVGTLNLCEVMQANNVRNLVFSSSATVYGVPESNPITEEARLDAINPYGQTKLMIEEILSDLYKSDQRWSIALLRYFNPVGSHPSGLIGEDPSDAPNNLMPYITQVAIGKLEKLKVFGDNYPTKDGTGVRDYIHVVDLANGHLSALKKVEGSRGIDAFNLGTGEGTSVLEMIETFKEVSGVNIPYVITERRSGDAAICYADPSKAKKILSWSATLNLKNMCTDAWNWQKNNPLGYE